MIGRPSSDNERDDILCVVRGNKQLHGLRQKTVPCVQLPPVSHGQWSCLVHSPNVIFEQTMVRPQHCMALVSNAKPMQT